MKKLIFVLSLFLSIGTVTAQSPPFPPSANGGISTTCAGDLTGTLPNCNVVAGAITLAKMANLAANSFICNNTGSGAVPIACSIAQAKTLLAIACADLTNASSGCSAVNYRTCLISNDSQSATVLTAAQLSGNGCVIPAASTIVEVDVTGGTGVITGTPAAPTYTGTSSIQIGKTGASSSTGLLSAALATVSGKACAKSTISQACILNGVTSSGTVTVSTTALAAGDELYVTAATADATQTWYAIAIIYTVN